MKIEISQGCLSDDIKINGVSLTYLKNRDEIEAKVLDHILPELKKRVLAGNISITNVIELFEYDDCEDLGYCEQCGDSASKTTWNI